MILARVRQINTADEIAIVISDVCSKQAARQMLKCGWKNDDVLTLPPSVDDMVFATNIVTQGLSAENIHKIYIR